ncbi:MAG: ATP-binding protein [Methylotenera sp.]
MNPRENPFSPGAGTQPPELAGRDNVIEAVSIALDRIRAGRSAKSVLMVGLRGVGKTVLLNRLKNDAESKGIVCVQFESPENRSLPSLIVPALRSALLKLDRTSKVKGVVKKAIRALGSFISSAKLKYEDMEFGFDLDLEHGVADSGDLDADLSDLMQVIGEAAKENGTAVVLFIDELQYVPEIQLASLISALHSCAQKQLPISLVGAGLPQLVGNVGRAKSYAERLFDFPVIGALTEKDARLAIQLPVEKEGVKYTDDASKEILDQTKCYPYFLQEWGSHSWDVAKESPIGINDVKLATQLAITHLDANFFRVRFDRCTPSERSYLRAMAEFDKEAPRSGDIASLLKKEVNQVAPLRQSLIKKGMVYSPSHGDTAFTVPLFAGYMKRTMPNF